MRIALLAVLVLVIGGCQNAPKGPAQRGAVLPTVAGRNVAEFDDSVSARKAFTRSDEDGVFTAILDDSAWLRFEGAPAEVEKSHRAYFVEGYTTFQIELSTDSFTQPTRESYMLEDSSGRRVSSKPVTYRSAMASGRSQFTYVFSVSFQHAITADTHWIRLTRQADDQTLEWSFQ